MFTSKLNNVLFGTAVSLFLLIVLSHFSSTDLEDDGDYQSYGTSLALKVLPSFSGSGGLGSVKNHITRSERQYQEMLEGRAWLKTQWEDPKNKNFFPSDSTAHYWTMPFTIWDFFPASFNCPHSINRLGRMGDGGKWLCGVEKLADLPRDREARPEAPSSPEIGRAIRELTTGGGAAAAPGTQPGCVAYSFGVQNESSFEAQLLARAPHCEVWGYDYSVDGFGPQLGAASSSSSSSSSGGGRAHFARMGVAGRSDAAAAPPFASIQDLMAANGHDHVDVVKMDIEGFEFEAMDSVVAHFRDQGREVPIAQFLVEIHLSPGLIGVDDFVAWWENLEAAGFRPVWTEPNLLVTTLRIHDMMPRFAEYTFLNIKDSRNPFLK